MHLVFPPALIMETAVTVSSVVSLSQWHWRINWMCSVYIPRSLSATLHLRHVHINISIPAGGCHALYNCTYKDTCTYILHMAMYTCTCMYSLLRTRVLHGTEMLIRHILMNSHRQKSLINSSPPITCICIHTLPVCHIYIVYGVYLWGYHRVETLKAVSYFQRKEKELNCPVRNTHTHTQQLTLLVGCIGL